MKCTKGIIFEYSYPREFFSSFYSPTFFKFSLVSTSNFIAERKRHFPLLQVGMVSVASVCHSRELTVSIQATIPKQPSWMGKVVCLIRLLSSEEWNLITQVRTIWQDWDNSLAKSVFSKEYSNCSIYFKMSHLHFPIYHDF